MNNQQFNKLQSTLVRATQTNGAAPAKAKKPKKPSQRRKPSSFALIRAPAASGSQYVNKPPTYNGARNITVVNTEYLAQMIGQTLPIINALTGGTAALPGAPMGVNPGNATLFPWLSGIASNFEEYRFKKLAFHFKSFMPSSEPGKIAMALDYDAADTVPGSIQEMVVNEDYTDSNVWRDCTLTSRRANRDLNTSFRYVRPGLQPANTDIKTYDVAQLFLAAYAVSTTKYIGDMWVEYECELKIPSNNGGLAATSYHSELSGGTASSPSVLNLVGQVINVAKGNIIGPGVATPTRVISLKAIGQYLLGAEITGTTLTTAGWTSPSGMTLLEQAYDLSASAVSITSWAQVLVTTLPAFITLPIGSYATLSTVDLTCSPQAKGF